MTEDLKFYKEMVDTLKMILDNPYIEGIYTIPFKIYNPLRETFEEVQGYISRSEMVKLVTTLEKELEKYERQKQEAAKVQSRFSMILS